MPWIKVSDCVCCGLCVGACPVGAVSMNVETAVIDEKTCIRCGKCHDLCPQEAVRHDSERIPLEVAANVQWAQDLLQHFESAADKHGLLERLKRFFAKERKVAEESIIRLNQLAEAIKETERG